MRTKMKAGDSQKPISLLQAYDQDNERFRQRVGKDRAQSSYSKLLQGRHYVADFLRDWYYKRDMALAELTPQFISDFAAWLSASRGLRGGTVWLACQLLKGVVSRACLRGLIPQNPFFSFRIAKNIRPREYLTLSEINKLASHQFDKPQQALARDLFVFAAYTGLAFADIQKLSEHDIVKISGQYWIIGSRQKTGIPYQVRLMSVPLDIIEHNRWRRQSGLIFGFLQYRSTAHNVSQVMAACGIKKHITMHCARHSFAIMALNAGMPIESVSRSLGHSNITTTQIYAKITMQKLNRDFDLLENGIRSGVAM